MAAGSIVIDLLMKTGSFVTDTGRAEKSLKSFKKTTVDVTGTLKGMLPLLSAGALTAWGKSVIDASDALNDLSIRTGVAVKDLASLELIAAQSDTSIESLGQGLNKLSRSIGQAEGGNKDAAEALKRLGVTTKDPIEGFLQLSDAVQKSTDRTKLNADLATVLGKSYQEFYVILSEGRTQLEASMKASEAYAIQQAKFAPQAAQFNDQLDILKQRLGVVGIAFIESTGILENFAGFVKIATDNVGELTKYTDLLTIALGAFAASKAVTTILGLSKTFGLVAGSVAGIAIALNQGLTPSVEKSVSRIAELQTAIDDAQNKLSSGKFTKPPIDIFGFDWASKSLKDSITRNTAEIAKERENLKKMLGEMPTVAPPKPTGDGGIGAPKETTVPTNPWSETTKDLAALIQKVQEAVNPNKNLNATLQEQLDAYYKLDPELKKYLQSQIDIANANERANMQAKMAVDTITERQKRLKELIGATSAGQAENQIKQATKDVQILNDALEADQISLKQYLQANDNLFGKTNEKINETKSFMKDLGAVFSSAFEQAVIDGQKFSGVLAGLANDIQRLITRKFITDPLMKGVDSIIGNAADKFGGWLGGTLFSAHGNVFDKSGVKAFATGGIVSSATNFAYGNNQLGVMGEAGPEAILPLSRVGGDLGIKAQIGTPVVNVNIHEAAGTRTSIEKSTDANGNMSIDVIVEQVESIMGRNIYRGAGLAPTIERRYGLNRAAGA